MKKNYTHKKKRSKQKGGWKWPWETDKVSSKKTKKKKIITPSPLPIDSERERQLQMWKNSPNMKQKLKEDEFERKAKKKLEELEKQTIPITYKNVDNDDDIFFTPNDIFLTPDDKELPVVLQREEDTPLSRQLSNISFKSAVSDGYDIEEDKMEDVQDELDINKTIWGLINEPRTIIMKLEGKLCEILPSSFQRLCGYTIYFMYEQNNLKIYKLTDTDNIDIINNNTIVGLLRANYRKFNPWKYPASVIVEEFYDDMNVAFFGNNTGSMVTQYSEETIEEYTGIYNNTQFIIQTQEIEKDIKYTFILDLTNILNNYDGSILKPDITISRCLSKDTNNNCINSCEECRYIKY